MVTLSPERRRTASSSPTGPVRAFGVLALASGFTTAVLIGLSSLVSRIG